MLLLLAQLLQQFKKTIGDLVGTVLFIHPSQVFIDLLLDRVPAIVFSLRCHLFVSPGNLVRHLSNM